MSPGAVLQVLLQSILRDPGAVAPTSAAAASQPQPSTQPNALTGRQQPRSAASRGPAGRHASGEVLLPARGGGQQSQASARASQASGDIPAPARGSGHRTRSTTEAGQAAQGSEALARGGGQQGAAGAGARSGAGLSEVSTPFVVMSRRFTNRAASLQEPGLQASKQGTQASTSMQHHSSAQVAGGSRLAGSVLVALQGLTCRGGSIASLRPPSPAPEGAAGARGEHCTACMGPQDCLNLPRPGTAFHRPLVAAAGARAEHSAATAGDSWFPRRHLCSHGIERTWQALECQPVQPTARGGGGSLRGAR